MQQPEAPGGLMDKKPRRIFPAFHYQDLREMFLERHNISSNFTKIYFLMFFSWTTEYWGMITAFF